MDKVKLGVLLVMIGLVLLLLSGCACMKKCAKGQCEIPVVVVKTVEVDKPVYVCPLEIQTLQTPVRPVLMIDMLTADDSNDPGKVGLYYKATIKQLLNYSVELEANNGIYNKGCEGVSSIPVQ